MKKRMNSLIKILDKRSNIVFAYLFGSEAKGYANEMSDCDVAIYFKDPAKNHGPWSVFELEGELSRALGTIVQITVLNKPLPPVFGFEILKEGIVLLDRNPGLRIDFENRILRHYYDWQYFLKRQMEAERRSR